MESLVTQSWKGSCMVGKTISHYKVIEKIGQGGMGEVYRAEDTNLDREVAIKVLPEQFTKDPQRLARLPARGCPNFQPRRLSCGNRLNLDYS